MLSEFKIVQNNFLGSVMLWQFTNSFYLNTNKKNGPKIHLTMLVLPMVFNKTTVDIMCNKNYAGGLYRSLEEDKTIIAGLQDRMMLMSDQTFKSLNIGFASGLIDYKKHALEIVPKYVNNPIKKNKKEIRKMLNTSKRIGYWFSEMNIYEVCNTLKVRF